MTSASEAELLSLFRGKQCCNVTFVLDGSESTRAVLGSVKRLLIQTLLTKASLRDSLFNIMTFSGQVNCWSRHMLPCAPDTVYSALSWVRSIHCSPGRDLLAALSMALTDRACHAVHVISAALPDQPEAVLRALPALAVGRPVSFFYLQESLVQLNGGTRNYLQCLTQATGGSCYVIPVGLNGELDKVVPLCESQSPTVRPLSCCCSAPSLMNASSALLRCSVGSALGPATCCVRPEIFPGCRVLARRQEDGFYYPGSVTQQVQGCTGAWVVEFDPPSGLGLGIVSSRRQLVCSLDMVNYIRAHALCLVPGDPVLSPWEPDLRRYGPGRVLAAPERRDDLGAGDGGTSLQVLMWNSCVSLVPASLVLPISASHHDRIVRELQIPTSTPGRYRNWPNSRPVSCIPQLFCSQCSRSSSCCCPVTNHWPYAPPCSSMSSPERTDGLEKAEQEMPDHGDVSKSGPEASSSPVSESDLRATFPPAVKLRRKPRPPWRYWRRTGSEPQHTQPGSAGPSRTPQPVGLSFPVPQISASPNHSSLFQSLSDAKGRRANVRDVLGMSDFKPQPPVGLQLVPGNNDATVYT